MEISRKTFYMLQIIIIGVAVVIAGLLVNIFLSNDIDQVAKETAQKAEMQRLQAAAFSYYDRLGFYDGVCSEVQGVGSVSCDQNNEAFAAEVRLESGGYYCVDSAGFEAIILKSKGNSVSCN